MTRTRFVKAERLFHEVLVLPESARAAFISESCADDAELGAMVQRLLAVHAETGTFLEPPEPRLPGAEEPAGTAFGQFRLIRLIGEGGMGAVYEAQQDRPSRRVALKILRSMLATPGQTARFELESQILARLKHPCIAQVYESGMHAGAGGTTPWYAMELIESAEPITAWAARRKGERGWSKDALHEVVSRFIDACEAVQHGHQQGIIHRDLKPANILIDASQRVRLIDFGIARMVEDDATATRAMTSSITGTLAYMPPEVFARGQTMAPAADTRGDIYALGVVLHELLTGRVPLDVAKLPLLEATEIITNVQPARPSLSDASISADADAIVLKSLAKDPSQRYQSLADLARDLRRLLAGEAVDARPPTLRYQLRVFARRHRTLVTAGAAIAITLVAATGVSVRFAWIANQRAVEAQQATRRAERAAEFLRSTLAAANPMLPAILPEHTTSDLYAPFGDWRSSRWPFAGQPGKAASVSDLLIAASKRLDREFSDDALMQASLADALGWTLFRLDRMAESLPLLQHATTLRRASLGDRNLETIGSMLHLAECLQNMQDRHPEAEPLYRDALTACESMHGLADHRTQAVVRQFAQYLFAHLNDSARADAMLESASRAGPDGVPGIAQLETMAAHAMIMKLTGRTREACDLAEQTINRLASSGDATSVHAPEIYLRCAEALSGSADRIELMTQWLRLAIDLRVRHFGEGGYSHAIMHAQLARALTELGRLEEARDAYRLCEQLFERMYGPDHFEPLRARGQLGLLLARMPGRENEACQTLESAAAGMQRLFGRLEGYGLTYALWASDILWQCDDKERSVAILEHAADWACIEPNRTIDAVGCNALFLRLARRLEKLGRINEAAAELRRGQFIVDSMLPTPETSRRLEAEALVLEARLLEQDAS